MSHQPVQINVRKQQLLITKEEQQSSKREYVVGRAVKGLPREEPPSVPYLVMEAEASPLSLIALVESVQYLGPRVKFSSLAQRFRGMPELASSLKVAQDLGLVTIGRDDVALTSLGEGFAKASDGKIRILRAGLSRIEPFRTSMELLSRKKSVSSRKIADRLAETGLGEEIINALLIEWGISSGLLTYDGRTREFQSN
jgi:hypothetical protein